jgi:hypothetical protein
MTDVFNEALRSWQSFYFMAGGASAGLTGLMFVALSLGTHLINDRTRENFKIFVTPSIFYFVSVLLLACVMLVPTFSQMGLAAILLLGGIVGLARTFPAVIRLVRTAKQHQDFDLWDYLTQIIWPVASYALILLAALGFVLDQWSLACIGLWLATIFLLICAISNTWSIVIWIIEQPQ